MRIEADSDVMAVLSFMQKEIAATRLLSVANGVAAMAPLLWGRYQAETVAPLCLADELCATAAQRRQSASSE